MTNLSALLLLGRTIFHAAIVPLQTVNSGASGGRMVITEDSAVQVFSITCRQRFTFSNSKSTCSVGEPFGTKKKCITHLCVMEVVRQIEQMRDVHHLDTAFEECPDNLASDLRPLSLVRRGKRFVAQDHAVGA